MRAREPNSSHWTRQVRKRRHYHRQWSGSNSWRIWCHRTWARELVAPQVLMAVSCPSTRWRCMEDHQLLMLLIRWTSGTTEWTFMTNCPSSLKAFMLRLQVRRTLKRVFLCAACLLLWSQKQNDQVIANASLFETEQKVLANTGINASVWTLELTLNGNELQISYH